MESDPFSCWIPKMHTCKYTILLRFIWVLHSYQTTLMSCQVCNFRMVHDANLLLFEWQNLSEACKVLYANDDSSCDLVSFGNILVTSQAHTQDFEKGVTRGITCKSHTHFQWPHPFHCVLNLMKSKTITNQITNLHFPFYVDVFKKKFTHHLHLVTDSLHVYE